MAEQKKYGLSITKFDTSKMIRQNMMGMTQLSEHMKRGQFQRQRKMTNDDALKTTDYETRRIEAAMIAVWFSCGAASAVAAKLTLEKYGQQKVRIINNLVIEEDADNQRFLKDVEKWLGVKIETAINPNFPDCSAVKVWEKRNYMSGIQGAPCTYELKKKARQHWENLNKPDWHVLGFTVEEKSRFDRFKLTERKNVLPILIDANLTKQDCMDIITKAGIEPPRIYKMGYPNANCIGCVKATSPEYWNHVRRKHPDIFEERAKQSRDIGARLVRYKGERVFLDELPENARGQRMKTMTVDCGIFCEELK